MATQTIIESPSRVVRRKSFSETYVGEWITTTDHKQIGIMYLVTGFFFFMVGGMEALLIRTQLAEPNGHVLTPEEYNQVFTMHGTTMIFLFVIPTLAGFSNYIVPLMIGARDMAFPRLNAFGYWVLFFGGIFLQSSFLFNSAPNGGWFMYAPLSELQSGCGGLHAVVCTPGPNADFWLLGTLMLGISSIAGSVNIVVTVLKLRAPGMSINRMPLFAWMALVQAFLLLFALPSLTAASVLLLLDRHAGTHFYVAQEGGDPAPVAAPVLVLWTSRSVHSYLASLWYHLRSVARLLTQANLWLYFYRVVWCGYRLPELYCMGAPHVRGWLTTYRPSILRRQYNAHRDPDGCKNL